MREREARDSKERDSKERVRQRLKRDARETSERDPREGGLSERLKRLKRDSRERGTFLKSQLYSDLIWSIVTF